MRPTRGQNRPFSPWARPARTWLFALIPMVLHLTVTAYVPKPGAEDPIPPLRPPRAEIPPAFWERHLAWISGAGLALAAAAGIIALRACRPRPTPPVLPENEARETLSSLGQKPETGAVLSGVTRAVRRYFIRAFDLPAEEPTTTEFCALMRASGKIGPELSTNLADFLKDCDRRKFAPAAPKPPASTATVSAALSLIDRAEARRAELRQAEAAAANPPKKES